MHACQKEKQGSALTHSVLFAVIVAAGTPLLHGVELGNNEQSCRDFVQEFYNWYLPVALKGHNLPSSVIALRAKPSLFDVKLANALRGDAEAQRRVSAEIVGIDFDPFLGSQDPGPRYLAREGVVKDGKCMAPVDVVARGKPPERTVLAETALREGRWIFVNFHYREPSVSKPDDLLNILAKLRAERKKGNK